ncbi:MAG: FAD-dependent oxidoreductase [Bacteroidia bacterium]|nr:FAD-dependent oxidoreductase [Bacteroidia bacterium]
MNQLANDQISSGRHLSYWLYSEMMLLEFESLNADIETDVVIVGAGIAGLSVAYQLVQSGKKVVVVEDGFVGSGETGRTTAHLTNALDDRYYRLNKVFGEEKAKLIAKSHTDAIDFIEHVVQKENIKCDFTRLNGYLFLHPSDKTESINKEFEAAKNAGIDVEKLQNVPGILNEKGECVEFKNQAQFHPLKYLNGLCKAILDKGGKIYTQTHAKDINGDGIKTGDGFTIKAGYIVVATNAPVNSKYILPMKQFAYRTYVIGAKIKKDSIPMALWWDTGDHNANASIPPYHYVRIQPMNDEFDLLICGGEDHATGLADAEKIAEEQRYKLLENWARERFPMEEVIYHWSGQVMEPIDCMAYIGKNPMDKDNIFIVTGDSGNGMTHGSLAGMLISDLINGKENIYENIYDPSRMKLRGIGVFFKEFVGGLFSYLQNKSSDTIKDISELSKDEGKIFEWQGKKCGIYRDKDDYLHIVDAECTHLKCIIKWNNDEKSWDCPCHGSRFTPDGKVINGPANVDLPHHVEKLDNGF